MSSTQTATIELSEIPPEPVPYASLAAGPGRPDSRVFDVEPAIVSRTTRALIISLIVFSFFVQAISQSTTVLGGFALSKALGQEIGPGKSNWMAASFPLTQSAFVLVSGRIGTIYGHKNILFLGGAVFCVMSLVNIFCQNFKAFIAVRVLTGIGGGLLLPNAVALITIMMPPGKWRNVAMGFFGAAAPLGGFFGGLFVGIFTELTDWKWLFLLLAGLEALTLLGLFFSMPKEKPLDPNGKVDFVGAVLGLSSLLIFNFVWNQAPSSGWSAPYEIALLIISVILFCLFLVWEKRYAKEPVMPLTIFQTPTFAALIFVVLLSYMSFGISQWYTIAWLQLQRDWTVLETAVGYTPFLVIGPTSVALAAWLIPRIEAQWILALGVGVTIISNLLIATMPVEQSYWPQTFPSIVLCCLCPDFIYVAAQLIASNSVSRRHQGVAGSLIGTLNLYGNGLGLGFSGTIETEITKRTGSDVSGYRAALYFGCALGVAALCLDLLFVRVPKDQREGWDPSEDVEDELVIGTGRSAAAEEQTLRR
ncbi:hypothetical protein G7046_g2350 [Stylonectria norvegica]|nr:hypothetical protein G7046_g2350 [Stylonectria norvegica]